MIIIIDLAGFVNFLQPSLADSPISSTPSKMPTVTIAMLRKAR